MNEKVETIRRAHHEKRSMQPSMNPAPLEVDSDEHESSPSPPNGNAAPSPARSRIRIICRAASVSNADEITQNGERKNGVSTSTTASSASSGGTATTSTRNEDFGGIALPITYYPGEEDGVHSISSPSLGPDTTPINVPAWLARRRARFQRSKTNPDLAAALLASSIVPTSPRVQQLLQARNSRLESSTSVRVGPPPPMIGDDGEIIEPSTVPVPSGASGAASNESARMRARRPSLSREAAEYRSRGLPLKVFGKKGGKEGELNWPRGLASLPGGLLAVADSSNHRICIFTSSDGKFMRALGEYGTAAGQLDSAAGVAAGRGRQLVVTDRYNHRVVVYDAEGSSLLFVDIFDL